MKGNAIMKKNIIIMVLLIIIIVLVVMLGMNLNKKCDINPPSSGDEDKSLYLETTNEAVQNIMENITTGVGAPCGLGSNYFSTNKVSVSDISHEILFRIAVKQIVGDDYRVTFSLDSVKAKIKNTFGSRVQFNAQTYDIIPKYNYNYDTASYEYQNDKGIEKVCTGDKTVFRVVKAMKTGNTLEVQVRVIFNKNGLYYSDPSSNNQLTNLEKIGNQISLADSNMRQGSLYKMIFNKENNHYIFVSSELIRQ